MDPITTWTITVDGVGTACEFDAEYRYAGGLCIAGFASGGGNAWQVYDLGGGQAAFSVTVQDQDGANWTYYWNSDYAPKAGYDNAGMTLWFGSDPAFSSDTIGALQTFRVTNLGQGTMALQATAGPIAGQYLAAELGGWYPGEWSLGVGSFIASATPAAFRISGDLLPLLRITNSGYDTDFSGHDLGATDLTNTNLQKCNLSGASLVSVPSISGADFTSATLHGTHLGAHNLATAKTWTHADFTGSDLTSIAGASPGHFESAVLDNTNLTGRDFSGAFLQGASFKGATLTSTNFTGAHLDGADFTGAHLGGTILHGAELAGTHFDHTDLSTAQFDPAPAFARSADARTTFVGSTVPFAVLSTNWSYLDLTGATITGLPPAVTGLVADGALLPDGLDLQGIDLHGASFVGTRMYEAQLQKANLESAVLKTAKLKGAKLSGANLTLANLDSAYLIAEDAVGKPDLLQDKREAAVVADAFLFNTNLNGAHCDGVDFSGSLFVTATAISATQSATAVGASMNFAKFDEGAVVAAVFDGAQLSAATFTSSSVVGATFRDNGATATQLTPSSDETHTPAGVFKADLRGADFTGANMDGLDMREATVASAGGSFEKLFVGYGGAKVPVAFDYQPTRLGDTTKETTCPDGTPGPCTIP